MPGYSHKFQQWVEAHPRLRVARLSLIVPLSAILMDGLWPELGTQVQTEFYVVTAQVIPVLLLAFFVEERGRMVMATQILEKWRTMLLHEHNDYSKEELLPLHDEVNEMRTALVELGEIR